MVGEPGQRVVGMAEHVGAGALPDLHAVDQRAADHLEQIGRGGSRHGATRARSRRRRNRPPPASARPWSPIRHSGRRRSRSPDNRPRSPRATHSAVNGASRRRQIAREPHGDFAFDADADEIPCPQRDAAVVNALCEHAAAAGMRNVQILLHHRAGAADLVADARRRHRRPADRGPHPGCDILPPRSWRGVGGERLQAACGRGGRWRWPRRPRECRSSAAVRMARIRDRHRSLMQDADLE